SLHILLVPIHYLNNIALQYSLNHNYLPVIFFFFNDTATTEIYTLSLHDALPISKRKGPRRRSRLRILLTIFLFCRCRRMSACKLDRKSTRLNSSHVAISYAVFCLKKKKARYISYPSHVVFRS